jgi:hypothetical protein
MEDALQHPGETSWAELWRLAAPGLGYAFLTVAAVIGLFTSSGTVDDATYASGLVTFAVAVLLIAARIKRQFDGHAVGFLWAGVATRDTDTLWVSIAFLTVLGIFGAILAASVGGTLYGEGIALFIVCAAFIFFDIKRYFDQREGGP